MSMYTIVNILVYFGNKIKRNGIHIYTQKENVNITEQQEKVHLCYIFLVRKIILTKKKNQTCLQFFLRWTRQILCFTINNSCVSIIGSDFVVCASCIIISSVVIVFTVRVCIRGPRHRLRKYSCIC